MASGDPFDPSLESYSYICHLLSECDKYFTSLSGHRSDIEVAPNWEQAYEIFRACLVLCKYNENTKPLTEIAGGISRYPKTASLLIEILRGLEHNLAETVFIWIEPDLRGPNLREERPQPAQSPENAKLALRLHSLHDAIMGSALMLSMVRDLVCPPRLSSLERYHDHRLTAFELALISTIERKE